MKPLILLVHGANHDGWCWSPVLERLDRIGVAGRAIDLPLTSFEEDTAAVRAAVREAAGARPVVLVAHSYGGLPVTAGGHLADRLVFVAARMPLPGESPAARTPRWGHPEFRAAWDTDDDGAVVLRAEAREVLYSHSPPDLAEAAARRWRPMRSRVPRTPIADPAWTSVPSAYVVCAKDRTVRVEAQRECAAHATESVEIDCDHSPFFSAPDRLTAILAEQATRAFPALPGY
ncbi:MULTISPECIES: alpha/beta fold hydrolase [unclassified Streptomyces]|uniref:alpha/beta fold hydrolase n=1 Tax=unclassified Streptomyces TaxID=2593676 RepID=UPI0033329A9F